MYSVISTEKYSDQIRHAVGKDNIIFEKTGLFNDIKMVLIEASRVFSEILIFDIDTVENDYTGLLEALKNYRVSRPETRIILIAPGRTPGDKVIAALVKLGIYDIIAPEAENQDDEIEEAPLILPYIVEAISKTSNYSDAARWDTDAYEDIGNKVKMKTKVVEKVIEKTIEKTIKQQIITFYTSDNSLDRDDVLTQTAALLAKKSSKDQKILVIDLNILTPSLDHFFGVDKELPFEDMYNAAGLNTGLKAVYNAIEKKIFAADLLEELAVKHKKLDNLFILTGIYDIGMFEKLQIKHYEKLIDAALEIYSTIIINTHPDISIDATYFALKRATTIIGITGANYTCARNMNYIINYLTEYHRIPKNKFKIVVNNISKHSLDKDYMKKLFEDYEVIAYIPFNPLSEVYLNKQVLPFILSKAASKDVIHYLDIVESLGYVPRISLKDRLFNKKRLSKEICTEELQVR